MQLPGPYWAPLNEALRDAFTKVRLEMMLLQSLEKRLDDLAMGGDYEEIVFKLIKRADSEGWIDALIKAAHEDNPGNDQLNLLVAELKAQTDLFKTPTVAASHPHEACFLRQNKLPFVNRADLRFSLKALTAQNQSKVLIVNGERGSGKSYTYRLIRYIADISRLYRVAWVDLVADHYPGFGPYDLTRLIALQLGADLEAIPEQAAASPRWSKELCIWLATQIRDSGEIWWIVLDGINQIVDLPTEMHDFIKALARQAELHEPAMRVVLLDYTVDELPSDIVYDVESEKIVPILAADLEQFFRQLFQQLGHDYDEPAIAEIVGQITATVPPPYVANRLDSLRRAVELVAQELIFE